MSGLTIAVLGVLLLAQAEPPGAPTPKEPPGAPGSVAPLDTALTIEDLGDDRYRIGNITVDKGAKTFTVPGIVKHVDEPLEYLAVIQGGIKEYESLLELTTTGSQFQIASILVGLDEEKSVKPRYQFDEREAVGQRVAIDISWDVDGKKMTVSADEALSIADPGDAVDDWVYIGSITQENGDYMADTIGSLIGFVHDPFAIIEHRTGLGIGAYGAVTGNSSLLPPEGAPVTVSVSVIEDQSGEDSKQATVRE